MHRNRDLLVITAAMVIPTLITLVYFQWLKDSQSFAQQIAFGLGKTIQFAFPVVFVWLCYREKFDWSKPAAPQESSLTPTPGHRTAIAIAFSLAVVVAMLAAYWLIIPTDVGNRLKLLVDEKVTSMGFTTPIRYLGLAVGYTFVHSFLEEYYWRWFVFDMLRKHAAAWFAIVVSSLGFMAHHVIVLGFFFGWSSPFTYLLSLGVAVGGSFWAWRFDQDGTLRNAWISHAIVDAGIFALGYWLVFRV